MGESDDVAFCQRLVTQHGVAAIPVSAFYAEGAVKNVVRFCFAKHDATLDAALERLAGVRGSVLSFPTGRRPGRESILRTRSHGFPLAC